MGVLVTGASGFVGAHLVKSLCGKGVRVRCLVRPTSRTEPLRTIPCQIFAGNLKDPAVLRRALDGVDIVYHLAGATRARSRQAYLDANVGFTRDLLDAAVGMNGAIRKFVHVSSLAAIGPSPDGTPFEDEVSPHPLSLYGKSKLEGEEVARSYGDRLPVTIVRPPAVYGPRERDIYDLIKLTKKHVRLSIGLGERKLSLLHVFDLVEFLSHCAGHASSAGRSYFISSGEDHTWKEVSRVIGKCLETWSLPVFVPELLVKASCATIGAAGKIVRSSTIISLDKAREVCARHWVCSPDRARAELGFQPRISLEDGMRSTIEWYRVHGWL